MLTQWSQVCKWFINSKMKAYIQRKLVWSDPESGSRIKRGGALPVKYSKFFGAKRRGFIKSISVLAPKGAIHLLNENIRYDNYNYLQFTKIYGGCVFSCVTLLWISCEWPWPIYHTWYFHLINELRLLAPKHFYF